jgi:hypothetical protein
MIHIFFLKINLSPSASQHIQKIAEKTKSRGPIHKAILNPFETSDSHLLNMLYNPVYELIISYFYYCIEFITLVWLFAFSYCCFWMAPFNWIHLVAIINSSDYQAVCSLLIDCNNFLLYFFKQPVPRVWTLDTLKKDCRLFNQFGALIKSALEAPFRLYI